LSDFKNPFGDADFLRRVVVKRPEPVEWDGEPIQRRPEPPASSEQRERLRTLEVDPDAARLAMWSPGECPRMKGHSGSEAAATAVERFLEDKKLRLLVLGGSTGRGKTVAATWLAMRLDATWWISAKDVRVGDAWDAMRSRALKAANLVIDDLGQERMEWASGELGSLMESRFDKGRRTLVTTNLPPTSNEQRVKTFASVYGDRLFSRLNKEGVGLYVACLGGDLRRQK
jgi:hypothetical protein